MGGKGFEAGSTSDTGGAFEIQMRRVKGQRVAGHAENNFPRRYATFNGVGGSEPSKFSNELALDSQRPVLLGNTYPPAVT